MAAAPVVMAIASVVGGGAGAYSSYQQSKAADAQGKSEAAWQKYNADVNMQEARVREQRAAVEAADARKQSQRALASQRTALSAAGIALSGSPLQVMEESAANMERSILDISRQGATEAQALRSQAGINLFQAQSAKLKGRSARNAYMLQGVGDIAGGVGGVASALKKT
jgi:hypothetical protein